MLIRKKAGMALVGLVMVIAILLVAYGSNQELTNRFDRPVAQLLPPPPAGWTVTHRAIADTPEMKEAVGELLNFDDGVFVDYVSGRGDRLSVYIAYWRAGKMSSRAVAGHTPDVCWVGNGWKRETGGQLDHWGSPARIIPRAEARTFSNQGSTEYVLFWHVLGDEVMSYGTLASPPWYAVFSDIFRNGLNQRKEQFFVRLSSPQPLDRSGLRSLMEPLLDRINEWAGGSEVASRN